jgi:hypothetical protein
VPHRMGAVARELLWCRLPFRDRALQKSTNRSNALPLSTNGPKRSQIKKTRRDMRQPNFAYGRVNMFGIIGLVVCSCGWADSSPFT